MKSNFYCLFLILIINSCTKPIEVLLDFGEPQLVMNSIIDATHDSIGVTLSMSRSIISSDLFQKVDDATVELYEDEQLIGQLAFIDSGVYVLNYRPIAGKEYEIRALYNSKIAKAKTIIPEAITFKLEKINEDYDDFKLTLENKDLDGANIWISVLSTFLFSGDSLKKTPRRVIYSSSACIDPFNSDIDTYRQYAYMYWNYLLLVGYKKQDVVEIYFGLDGNITRSNEIIVNVFDDHLSSYVKSSIMASDVDRTKGKMPFYIDPVEVYTNVEDGIGIVGSINSNSQELFNHSYSH